MAPMVPNFSFWRRSRAHTRVQLVPSGCLALAGWGWRKLLNNRLTVKEMRVQNQKNSNSTWINQQKKGVQPTKNRDYVWPFGGFHDELQERVDTLAHTHTRTHAQSDGVGFSANSQRRFEGKTLTSGFGYFGNMICDFNFNWFSYYIYYWYRTRYISLIFINGIDQMLLATVNDPKAGWEPWTESWLFTFPTPYLGVDPLWNDLPEVLIYVLISLK